MSVFGSRIPRELKMLPGALATTDDSTYKSILKYVLTTLEGGVNRRNLEDILGSDNGLNLTVLAGLFCLLRALFRIDANVVKPETLQSELQDLKLSQDVITDVVKILSNQRSQTLHNLKFKSLHFPTIVKFSWRIDVSISTSSLCRILEPTIMCEIVLSNGDIKHFEMTMKTFHNLRCQVATVLKEMHQIEQRDLT